MIKKTYHVTTRQEHTIYQLSQEEEPLSVPLAFDAVPGSSVLSRPPPDPEEAKVDGDLMPIKANAASGMAVHDDCKLRFSELKSKRNYRFITFKIEDQQVVVDKTGGPNESYENFTDSLPNNECRYAVFDFDFTTDENVQKSKILFIAWSPDTSKVRMKMVYASSKDRFKRELDGIQLELQATDPSEMSLDIVKARAI
ncbi:hypothetical protein SSX86_018065 [Deinandra increscens subsp. villosa]|uniref:ADF-H domain-containing protein n=1 Tax=Deinandra increscens subsp. villosa TaxID=3103831 RepID=A0AAP0GW01_9ASTR